MLNAGEREERKGFDDDWYSDLSALLYPCTDLELPELCLKEGMSIVGIHSCGNNSSK